MVLQPGIPSHLLLVARSGMAANSPERRGAHSMPLNKVLRALTPHLVNEHKESQDRIVYWVLVKNLVFKYSLAPKFCWKWCCAFFSDETFVAEWKDSGLVYAD